MQIPTQLKAWDQWILWKSEVREGKPTKIPCDAGGRPASVTDPAAWHTYDDALLILQGSPALAGLGFCFTPDDPFIGIDLDGCFPNPSPAAQEILTQFETYQEISPSGTGVKIFAIGSRGDFTRMRTAEVPGFKQLEVYDRDRFFTVTGQQFGFDTEVTGCQGGVDWLFETYLPNPVKSNATPADRAPLDASDEEILTLMFGFANGEAARRLWNGEMSAFADDHSAADLALVAYLAFVVGPDPDRIASLFAKSDLYRDKWDRADYRERTITKVLDEMTDFYAPGIGSQDVVELGAILDGLQPPSSREGKVASENGSAPEQRSRSTAQSTPVSSPAATFPIPERGLIRDVVDLFSDRTEVPDETLALCMLATMSAVTGWNRSLKWGESPEPAVLYAMIIGKSASAKKSTGMRTVSALWKEAGVDVGLTGQHTSGRALLEAAIGGIDVFRLKEKEVPEAINVPRMAGDDQEDHKRRQDEYDAARLAVQEDNQRIEDLKTQKLENPPSIVLEWDEFGTMLNVQGRWQEDTRVQLLQMYNGRHSGIQTSGRDGVKVPGGKTSMSLIGTMTMDDLCRSLNMGQVADGLIGRILFSPPGIRKPPRPKPPEEDQEYLDRRYEICQSIAAFAERVKVRAYSAYSGWSEGADEVYNSWYVREHKRTQDIGLEEAMFARGASIVVKIASLLAAAEDTGWSQDANGLTIVEAGHMAQAIAIVEASFGVAMQAVQSQILSQRDRWLDAATILLEAGDMGMYELTRKALVAKEPGDRSMSQVDREKWVKEDGRFKTFPTNNRGVRVRLATVEDV